MASPQAQPALTHRNCRYRRWCFTVNNPQVHYPSGKLPENGHIKGCVYQLEQGANGTPHWQGYVEFDQPMSMGQVRAWLPHAHFSKCNGTREQNIRYCTKDDTRVEGFEPVWIGTLTQTQGKRNDLDEVVNAIKQGASERQIYDDYPAIAAKYPGFIKKYLDFVVADNANLLIEIDPKEWQRRMLKIVEGPVNSREIIWICDYDGGKGKSYLTTHLVDGYGAFMCNGGKGSDIVYAYNGQKICVFDYVRDAQDYVNYGVMEQIKNGCLFSGKYNSSMKRFNSPHVIVFANFMPDQTKMSKDRWVIIDLKADDEWEIVANGTRMGAALEFM